MLEKDLSSIFILIVWRKERISQIKSPRFFVSASPNLKESEPVDDELKEMERFANSFHPACVPNCDIPFSVSHLCGIFTQEQ